MLIGQFSDDGGKRIETVIACANTRTGSLENRYQISPAELIIERESRLAGRDIVGFYHSHPDSPPRWSSTDLDEAHWTDRSYVIISVEAGKAALTNSFVLQGTEESKHFADEEIEVCAEA